MTWYLGLSAMDQFLVDMFLKSGLVLLAAWAIAALLSWRGGSAAVKHAVWSLAIGGAIAMPLFVTALPAFRIWLPWLPTAPVAAAPESAAAAGAPVELALAPVPALKLNDVSTPIPASSPPAGQPAAGQPPGLPSADATFFAAAVERLSTIFRIWLLGVAMGLLPTILGWLSLCRLQRCWRRVTAGPLLDALALAKSRLGLNATVKLLISPERSMPMTWGLWRPVILLPEQAEAWTHERLHVVLLHELAHVQRRDCLLRLLAQLARAVYWFNPLAWLAQQQICTLQEQAADDLVLACGCDGPGYAEHLLAVSSAHHPHTWAAGLALAMARAVRLERRIVAILDSRRNRRRLTPLQAAFLTAMALAWPALLAVMHWEVTAAEPQTQAKAKADQPAAKAEPADPGQALAELRAKIAAQYVTPVDDKRIAQGAIRGMVEALHDPYSDYLSPERVAEMERQVAGALVGIGAQLDSTGGRIRVVTPLEDSPALNAGVQAGDMIVQIDGQSTEGLALTEAVKQIVGPAGTTVRLKLARGEKEVEIGVVRGPIRVASVKGIVRGTDKRWTFLLDAGLLDAGQKIGYLQLTQLGSNTPQELRTVVESLQAQGLKGLIVDLRSCPGGLLESAVAVVRLFQSEGNIVSLHSRGGEVTSLKAEAKAPFADIPLVVLVNAHTASAAEIVAGAWQDNRRATLVGTRSFGKGSVQSIIQLDDGQGAIRLTTAQYQLPSGRNIDRQPAAKSWGIEPTEGFFVPLDRAQIKTLTERAKEREIIGSKSADVAQPAAITAEWLETKQADPQLAAALRTLTARLTTGEFVKVSNQSAAQIEAFLKQEDVQRRREAVLQDLQRLQGELTELDKAASTN